MAKKAARPKKRGVGRPAGRKYTAKLHFSMTPEMWEALEVYVLEYGLTGPTEAVRRILAEKLGPKQ